MKITALVAALIIGAGSVSAETRNERMLEGIKVMCEAHANISRGVIDDHYQGFPMTTRAPELDFSKMGEYTFERNLFMQMIVNAYELPLVDDYGARVEQKSKFWDKALLDCYEAAYPYLD
ncbi:hypothetical protein C1J03_15145 [Sulfitobacter sp. SK012]|uniref:hypothetical protein n=1 Tax=Sulfitobacter sp. SK012 TaxID=1389005 RepID=UPI000E09F2FE|nr:hypothetical protein [Sulfitobacter sp. SK012]AXI47229.1 hypothetical protein C1J03_15145 [Sulfitobacter sp. SK012]